MIFLRAQVVNLRLMDAERLCRSTSRKASGFPCSFLNRYVWRLSLQRTNKSLSPGKPKAYRNVLRHRRRKNSSLFLPVNSREILRIEQLRIKRHVGAQLGILFRRYSLAVHVEDNFRRHPAAAELLVLVELRFLRLGAVASPRPNHAHKIQVLLVDPELRRMKISCLCADDINRPPLPHVLAKD